MDYFRAHFKIWTILYLNYVAQKCVLHSADNNIKDEEVKMKRKRREDKRKNTREVNTRNKNKLKLIATLTVVKTLKSSCWIMPTRKARLEMTRVYLSLKQHNCMYGEELLAFCLEQPNMYIYINKQYLP